MALALANKAQAGFPNFTLGVSPDLFRKEWAFVVDCCQPMSEFTHILDRVQRGDPKAANELLPLVYEELRKLAAHRMASEAPGQTLQPTALVHEAWLRLVGSADPL